MIATALAILAGFALPVGCGWFVVAWVAGPAPRSALGRLGRGAVAMMVGLGLSSLAAFAWLLAGGALDGRYVVADAVLLIAAAAAAYVRRRAFPLPEPALAPALSAWDRRLGVAAVVALGIAAVAAVWSNVQLGVAAPHGQWDAWVIWNLRARFLLRAGTEWRVAFAPELYWSQTPYPLFLPLTVARLWAYAGETPWAPALLSTAMTLGVPFVLAGAVASAAGPLAGGVAGLLLLGAPGFVATGAMQYADVPLAGFLVAGMAALVASARSEGRARTGALALGGFILGIAGWTKNEGVAAALACVLAAMLHASRRGGLRAALGALAPIAAGAALPAAAWIAFQSSVAPSVLPLYLSADQTAAGLADKLADPARWAQVILGVARRLPGIALGLPLVTVALALMVGSRPRAMARSGPLLAAALLLGIDVVVFVTTTFALDWHLGTAADRLVLQAWPLVLLGLFAAVGPVTEAPAAALATEVDALPREPRD